MRFSWFNLLKYDNAGEKEKDCFSVKNTFRILIKHFLSKIPFIQNYFSGIATIFMFHRVHPFEENRLFPNENMKVSSEFLESFIVEQ